MANVQEYTGQQIVDGALNRLGGYANAVDPVDMLDFINEGKNEIWTYLKGLRQDYFGHVSQATTPTGDDYFGPLSVGTREYALPPSCREIKTIEVLTSGYESVVFQQMDMSNDEFRAARRESTQVGPSSGSVSTYLYDQFGTQFVLAQFPQAPLQLAIFYIAAVPDIEMNEIASEFLFPFWGKLKNYGCRRATLGLRDFAAFDRWKEEWKNDIQSIVIGADSRNIGDPVFVEDFMDCD